MKGDSHNPLTAMQFEEWIANSTNQFFVDFVAKVMLILDILENDLKKLNIEPHGDMARARKTRQAKADAVDAIRKLL